jgi:hypothetical protein
LEPTVRRIRKESGLQNDEGIHEYIAGDKIRWEVTVTHDPDIGLLRSVKAVFEHQDGAKTSAGEHEANRIKLKTNLLTREPDKLRTDAPPTEATSHGALQGSVSAINALGEYTCLYVEATYEGGRPVLFDPESTRDRRFRVVEAPVPKPRVTGSKFRL